MRLSTTGILLACFVVLCGCNSDSETTTAPSAGNADDGTSGKPNASEVSDDPMSVEATPAREFTLAWVGNVGDRADDPMDLKQVKVRGQVARMTPERWFYAENLKSREASVWLYGESLNWAYLNENWLNCEFEDAAAIEKLQPGQTVVIEGRYRHSPTGDIRIEKCQLLAAGKPPEAQAWVELLSMKEWQDAARRLAEISASNKQAFRLVETGRKYLMVELEEKLFSEQGNFPAGVIDTIAAFPIEEIECAGNGAKALLASLDKFPRLRALTFKEKLNCEPDDLKQLEKAGHLNSLTFDDCEGFNDDYVTALAGLTHLRELTLDGGYGGYDLSDKSIEEIAKLNELRLLILNYKERLTDRSLSLLAGLPHLRDLALKLALRSSSAASQITDAGLAALPEGSFPNLLFLDLSRHPKITDAGIEALIKLKLHLASLDLYGTGVTDAGLVRIVESKLTDRVANLPNEPAEDVRRKLIDAKIIRAD